MGAVLVRRSFRLQNGIRNNARCESSIVTECSNVGYESVGSTSSSLLDRVKVRDEAAWQRLVRVYGPLVLYWCRCAGVQRADRVDVCQDVFKAVAVNIDGFRHDQPGNTFRGWLRTITRNKVADHFRRQNRQPTAIGGSAARERFLAIPDGDVSSAIEAGDQERAVLITQVLDLIRAELRIGPGRRSGRQQSNADRPAWLPKPWR